MKEYFKGWRRKGGVATLLMACVFMTGWMRSLAFYDEVRFHSGSHTTEGFISGDSTIGWERRHRVEPHDSQSIQGVFVGAEFLKISDLFDDPGSRWHWNWNWYWYGFGGGVADFGYARHTFWAIPYWSITVPLTVISPWLLFTKPRKSIQKKIAEPLPTEVA